MYPVTDRQPPASTAPLERSADQRTATALLRDQHEQLERSFSALAHTTGARRGAEFARLSALLAVHEVIEEVLLYPLLRSLGDDAALVAEQRIAEADIADRALADLKRLGCDGHGFLRRAWQLERAVMQHAHAEDASVFPLVERRCGDDMLRELGEHAEIIAMGLLLQDSRG